MNPSLHELIPWQVKIAAKMVLARIPIPMWLWHRLGLFVPGSMRDPAYAVRVFETHWRRAGCPGPGFTYLELGPGESLATAVVAWAFGANSGALVDAGDFAVREIEAYRPLIDLLSTRATVRDVSGLLPLTSLEAVLERVNATVRTDGLAGLESLPADSADLVFSQAVLEHVPLTVFAATAREIHRIQKPGARGSHRVDFKDHLQASLNNLRFTEKVWEQPWFAARSGFYTNRLRLSDMIAAFERAGFSVSVAERGLWSRPPIARRDLAFPFRDMTDDDLRTFQADLVLTKECR